MGSVYCLALILRFSRSSQLVANHALPESGARRLYLIDIHTAFNVASFPPLFFFSALYYTDVSSTVAVLTYFAYIVYRHCNEPTFGRSYGLPRSAILISFSSACIALIPKASLSSAPTLTLCLLGFLLFCALYQNQDLRGNQISAYQRIITILIGASALMFRQTNLFWVSVYPIGCCLVSTAADGKLLPELSSQSLPASSRCQNSNRNISEGFFEGMSSPLPWRASS